VTPSVGAAPLRGAPSTAPLGGAPSTAPLRGASDRTGSDSGSGPRRRFVVRADGGSRGNPGPAAYGALVCDADSGEVLAEDAATIGTTTNNVAEYRGLIAGLALVRALDPDAAIEVRMDSKLVVEQMAGRWKIKHADLRPLAEEARQALPAGQARWTWVPREENRRADALANAALDGRIEQVIEHPLPTSSRGGSALSPSAAPPPTVPPGPVPGRSAELAGSSRPAVAAPDGGLAAGDRETLFAADPTPRDLRTPSSSPDTTVTSSRESRDTGHALPAVGSADGSEPLAQPVAADTTTLLFLRHARTQDNVRHRFSGPYGADPGLDETGRAQALAVARALTVLDVVVSSPMRRTLQTARVLAAEADLPVTVLDELVEYDSGAWDGLTAEEAAERDPALYAGWLLSPDVAPPGGESVREVARRVSTAVRTLVGEHRGQTVLVVSHAVPIACALLEVLEAPLSSAARLTIRNTSLSRVHYPITGPPLADVILLPPGVPLPD